MLHAAADKDQDDLHHDDHAQRAQQASARRGTQWRQSRPALAAGSMPAAHCSARSKARRGRARPRRPSSARPAEQRGVEARCGRRATAPRAPSSTMTVSISSGHGRDARQQSGDAKRPATATTDRPVVSARMVRGCARARRGRERRRHAPLRSLVSNRSWRPRQRRAHVLQRLFVEDDLRAGGANTLERGGHGRRAAGREKPRSNGACAA